MRYEARMRRLASKLPRPRKEIIVSWVNEIFSTTKGWRIQIDTNGVVTKTGNVPPECADALIRRLRPEIRETEVRETE